MFLWRWKVDDEYCLCGNDYLLDWVVCFEMLLSRCEFDGVSLFICVDGVGFFVVDDVLGVY